MSVQRVYVGEPGGENLDVLRENTNKETQGQARFLPGDVATFPDDKLAKRLDRSWDTPGSERGKAALQKAKERKAEEEKAAKEAESNQGGDE